MRMALRVRTELMARSAPKVRQDLLVLSVQRAQLVRPALLARTELMARSDRKVWWAPSVPLVLSVPQARTAL